MGYEVFPAFDAPRSDIISAINLKTPEALVAFCQGIQAGSPVDSFVKPEPWDMPGYSDQVVMAAGAFTMGASIELSADGPIRPPYAVWLQGGLTYETGRTGVLLAAQEVLDSGAARHKTGGKPFSRQFSLQDKKKSGPVFQATDPFFAILFAGFPRWNPTFVFPLPGYSLAG